MLTRDQLERRVAKSDSMGLIVYALTLVGELPCAFVRGWLVGIAFGVAGFIATGNQSFPDIGPVRVVAAFAPLVWSLTAFSTRSAPPGARPTPRAPDGRASAS